MIDALINIGAFSSWVDEFAEGESDRILWDIWVHRIFDKSFADFKKSLEPKEEISDEQVADIISDSMKALENFVPEG